MTVKDEKRVSSETLGAWVFKCNPKVWNIGRFVEDGNDYVDDWSVVDNYRSDLMNHGQPAILWVQGDGRTGVEPGLWGVGWIAGPPRWTVKLDDDALARNPGYYEDLAAASRHDYIVPTDIFILEKPIPRAIFKEHPILGNAEMFRQPQMANPSFLTLEQFEALRNLLDGEWPDPMPDWGEEVRIGTSGAAFGDPLTNSLVEAAAMGAVTEHLLHLGYEVADVSAAKVGWDITATSGRSERRVEVKGVAGTEPRVLLTRNEVRTAESDPYWELAIVTQALTEDPLLWMYNREETVSATAPLVYEADLRRDVPPDVASDGPVKVAKLQRMPKGGPPLHPFDGVLVAPR